MIRNLPQTLSIESLDSFHFGDVDAKADELLNDYLCICKTAAINEFLRGRRSLIVGERGSGKTALFELVRDGKLKFEVPGDQLILPIDEELEYKAIKNQLSNIYFSVEDEPYKVRIVWETYILYRILKLLDKAIKMPPDFAKSTRGIRDGVWQA